MPVVQVQLFADLQKYSPVPGKSTFSYTGEEGVTIAQLLAQLNIPVVQEILVVVNGAAASADRVLLDGDRLAIFRPLDGG
ncbi:MAG: MoaD/ThiS family protein [Syntrophomonadaceae bacterium]|nr:MoaD/ThiS family protein [Syntrophomonadaceae bacterium]